MRITLQIHEDEPLRDEVLEQIRQAIEQTGVDAEVETVTVRTDDEAKAIRCLGSPTIRVAGYDVEYGDREPPETTTGARFYATPDGWSQVPHAGMIAFAIREAQQRQPSS